MSTEPRDEYTPTIEEVRDAAGPDGATAIEHAAFDRFLAAHDREVAERAWEEGRLAALKNVAWPKEERETNPYREGRTDA